MSEDDFPVGFVHSDKLLKATSNLPKVLNRSALVYGLIYAYKLDEKLEMIEPISVSEYVIGFFPVASFSQE